jgi:CRISP-associated protein Cas1
MLMLPDFKQKHILFIFSQESDLRSIKFGNENIKVYDYDKRLINQVSIHTLISIYIVGDGTFTTPVIKKAKEHGVSLFFLGKNLLVYAAMLSEAEGNVFLRKKQYVDCLEKDFAHARILVANKVWNQQMNLKKKKLLTKYKSFEEVVLDCEKYKDADALRGFEGAMSRQYFGLFFEEQNWYKRMPRAKQDIHNFLMDIGYSLLFNLVESILRLFGFDTYVGFYHKIFYQRKSLACDLMEPFRVIVDNQIRNSFNLKQIDKKDFKMNKNNEYNFASWEIRKKYVKFLIDAIMDEKEEMYVYIRKYYYFILNNEGEMPLYELC